MKELIVERAEKPYMICKDKGNNYFAIEEKEMPEGVKLGDTIIINDSGEISMK